MLKKPLIVIGVALVALLLAISLQANTYTVSRSITINAAPDKVYTLVSDFHNWPQWSPWEKLDPNMTRTFSGAPAGTGAIYAWKGNDQVGSGRMTIQNASAPAAIDINLEFIEPFPSTAKNTFAIQPQSNQSAITWSMTGDHNFMSKAMCLFMGGMDKMIGPDFEKGLAQLKTAAESN